MRRRLIGLVTSALALACAGEKLDVGSKSSSVDPGAGGTGPTLDPGVLPDAPLPSFPDPHACVTGEELPIVGTWDGYVEGSSPGSYNDSFRVTIFGASEESGVCGTVVYGEGTPPPAATDPDIGYPSADTGYGPYVMTPQGPNIFGSPGSWGPMPGVPFTIVNGSVDASRARFGVAWAELWEGWCALQTAYDGFCLPNTHSGFGPPGECRLLDTQGHEMSVECGKYNLCLGHHSLCECNAIECVASTAPYQSFDLHFDGDSADGSVTDGAGGRARLFRVE